MRYRIKIKTFKNGREEYKPYIKNWCGWCGLDFDGKKDITFSASCANRDKALKIIDLNFSGNNKVHTIEFEYFKKF